MGLQYKIYRGYHLYNTYTSIYGHIMFNPRYRNINNNLLRRYIALQYVRQVLNLNFKRRK